MAQQQQVFSGMNFKTALDGMRLKIETATLALTINGAATQSGGVPNGFVHGDFAAEGELVLDGPNAKIITQLGKQYGSIMDIPPMDLEFFAGNTGFSEKVNAYGCKLIPSDLVNIDAKGGTKTTKTYKYVVTSPDFVRIDDVPVIPREFTEDII